MHEDQLLDVAGHDNESSVTPWAIRIMLGGLLISPGCLLSVLEYMVKLLWTFSWNYGTLFYIFYK